MLAANTSTSFGLVAGSPGSTPGRPNSPAPRRRSNAG
ncbi:hypothetical protein [Kutzneria sp. 744]